MSFDLNDVSRLGPRAREQIAAKLAVTMVEGQKMQEARTKYGAKKTTVESDGNRLTFDSQKEARRFKELLILQRAGKIRDLHLQEHFLLQRPHTLPTGQKIKREEYVADFVYDRRVKDSTGRVQWAQVVEDVKGYRTSDYVRKKNRMLDLYGIEILET